MLDDVVAFHKELEAVKPNNPFYEEAKKLQLELLDYIEACAKDKELPVKLAKFNVLLNSLVRNQAALNAILSDSLAKEFLSGMLDVCDLDPSKQYTRTMYYLSGMLLMQNVPQILQRLKTATSEKVSINNNNDNVESAASFKPVVKSKTSREVKIEMLKALSDKIISSDIKTAKEGMDFIKQYVNESADIKPSMKALALQGMDKEVEKLLKEVKPEGVSNVNISPQL